MKYFTVLFIFLFIRLLFAEENRHVLVTVEIPLESSSRIYKSQIPGNKHPSVSVNIYENGETCDNALHKIFIEQEGKFQIADILADEVGIIYTIHSNDSVEITRMCVDE
ncbi:hypothetical protein N9T15_00535, partial [Pelagibacteraceae bacterium]|nr:hypothetical protein [Pelagibacteraceae bacterium]